MKQPPPFAPRRGRVTLQLAVCLLGLLLVGQLVAMAWALHRKHARGPVTLTTASQPASELSEVADSTAASSVSPRAESSAATTAGTTNARQANAAGDFPILDERVRFFLGSALASREQGDMKAALTQLRAACDLQPGHPRLLYELATTYEKMSLPAKATPVWDQLAALGENGGIYFKLAQARFEQGDVPPAREVETPLRLGKILERPQQDPAAGHSITLRIPVQALEGAVIDPGLVSVVTQFYDEIDGEIVETDAATDNWRWLSGEFPTWKTNSVEFLDQPYRRSGNPSASLGGGRRYHGYVVKLYYNDHLQDMVAHPAQLANRRAEPGERGLQHPVELYDSRPSPARQLDDSLFPPLPQ
ncbi:MAG: tetratricopeptide repeat protein [Verrucomicrobiales bacterium]